MKSKAWVGPVVVGLSLVYALWVAFAILNPSQTPDKQAQAQAQLTATQGIKPGLEWLVPDQVQRKSAPVAPAPGDQAQLPAGAREAARVVRVIDGDTIDVTIGDGSDRVRYFGIDAPEQGQRCSSEATARNRELVGGAVYLESDARGTDTYGRLLRYVYGQGGTFVDAQLIREGLATAWTRDGKHRDYLVGLEAEARRNRVGCLWR